jgi:hypothetical protein
MAHFKLAQAYSQAGKKELAEAAQETTEGIRLLRLEFAQLHQLAWDRPADAEVRLRLAELASQLDRPDLADVWLKSASALKTFPARGPAATTHKSAEPSGK